MHTHEPAHTVDACVAEPPAWKWLVREARDLRHATELAFDHRRLKGATLEQREVAKRAGEEIVRAGKSSFGEVDRADRSTRVKPDLQPEGRRAFNVRLHGAGDLAVMDSEDVLHPRFV